MPILMCHGSEDSMVPISVARSSCALKRAAKSRVLEGSTLAGLGYKVNLITFKGLKHQLSPLQFDELIAFYREVIPERLEIERIPRLVLRRIGLWSEGCKASRLPGMAS